jgi:ankyrin repeat protein
MNSIPIEILELILRQTRKVDTMRFRRVCSKWKNLIETKFFQKDRILSIEDCIIEQNYYHFLKFMNVTLSPLQKKLVQVINNPFFKRHCGIVSIYAHKNFIFIEYVKKNNINVVNFLMKRGVKAYLDSALYQSTFHGHYEITKLLLEAGANPNINNGSPLIFAARYGYLNIVKLLLEYKADVHAKKNDALCWGATKGYLDIVKLLIEHGADVNAEKCKVLYWSIQNENIEVTLYLLEKGANPDLLDRFTCKELQTQLAVHAEKNHTYKNIL